MSLLGIQRNKASMKVFYYFQYQIHEHLLCLRTSFPSEIAMLIFLVTLWLEPELVLSARGNSRFGKPIAFDVGIDLGRMLFFLEYFIVHV